MTEELTLEKKNQIMTTNQIKDQDIAHCIESCAIDNEYWIDKEQIAKQLQVPVDVIQKIVKKSQTIVLNSEGELTTRALYKQRTPFFDKLLNSIKNKID
ncbi:MAG: hypothetical protein HRT67_02405 [Flavobacteriaceae bacterium]|nr:hypothetical protein [Flavobacteriaceae bacterium]